MINIYEIMDYQRHYNKLIKRARNRLLESYTENHHIIPRCMNGSDDSINLVALTPEEHYVAHQLLVKIYPNNYKLIHAAKMMTVNSSNHFNRNNKLYGWLKKKSNEAQKRKVVSEQTKNRIGNGNRGKKRSEDVKREKSESMLGEKNHNYGRMTPKEVKQKISKTLMGNISKKKGKTYEEMYSEEKIKEYKEKLRNAVLGTTQSEESNKKRSETLKKKYAAGLMKNSKLYKANNILTK